MSRFVKILIGFAAALFAGWLYHGPLGAGAALIDRMETDARAAIAATELPGISVAMARDPLARTATLSGTADDFQRQGMGELPGINDRVGAVEGMANIGWSDDPAGPPQALPLLAEVLLAVAAAFLIGLAIGWLLFGRPRRESYL